LQHYLALLEPTNRLIGREIAALLTYPWVAE
jgi:hypothetical protein